MTRLTIAAVLAALLPLATPAVGAAAGGSCTGWQSTTTPPSTIRVLRVATGKVDTVDFRKYVLIVTAKEWGPTLPQQLINAGAVASKQYAWYWSLAGKWRGGSSGGKCYDVEDSTADQLYNPSTTIYDKHRLALSTTWGTTVWRDGKFVLTPYRLGIKTTCGPKPGKYVLLVRSARRCVNKEGWGWQKVLVRYYAAKLRVS